VVDLVGDDAESVANESAHEAGGEQAVVPTQQESQSIGSKPPPAVVRIVECFSCGVTELRTGGGIAPAVILGDVDENR
jgi:hypothetical protein